jgi:hypothetical protein
MRNAIVIGIIAGLIFGFVLVWQGAGAAGLVLLFSLIGLVVGVLAMVIYRIFRGDVDREELRSLFSSMINPRER